jgi:hypothetical protein
MLHIKCRILNGGDPVTAKDKVAFVNMPLQSIIRQLDVSLQQQNITTGVGLNYSYKAIIDTLLWYQEDPKESHLQSQLFIKDDADFINAVDPEIGGNIGLLQRWDYTKDGQVVDLEGGLYVDICQQDKLLINGVRVDIKFFPNTDNFVLMSPIDGARYTYEIVDCVLKVCHVTLNPALTLAHADVIKHTNAVYNFTRSDLRTYNIPAGTYSWNGDDLFNGNIPSRVIVGIVDTRGYSGSYIRNPYSFEHHDCNFIGFYVDGQSLPGEPLLLNYTNNQYMPAYLSLFTGLGRYHSSFGNEISRDEYKSGYCFYVFDIDSANSKDFVKLMKKGHTRLSIRFENAPKTTLSVIVYGQFPGMLQIDEARNILI